MSRDEALSVLWAASGWTKTEVARDPDSAHWKATERIGEARRVLEKERAK